MTLSFGQLVLRLVVTAALCGAIGLEREARDQVAGLRTHILVGVGSALFTLVSAYGFSAFPVAGGSPRTPGYDPTRIAAQIVSGIGFLGAGAIIRQGFNVRGVTTAASLWIVAAVGMAAGAGYYSAAIVTTALSLVALIGFRRLRPLFRSRVRADYAVLEFRLHEAADVHDVFTALAGREVRVRGMETEQEAGGERVRLELRVPSVLDERALLRELRELEGVEELEVVGGPEG